MVSNVTRKMAYDLGGVVAVTALEGLHAAVLGHMRQTVLLIGAVVAPQTLEATGTLTRVHKLVVLSII